MLLRKWGEYVWIFLSAFPSFRNLSCPSPWGSVGAANYGSSHFLITLANHSHSLDIVYGDKTHRQAVEGDSLNNPSISLKLQVLAWGLFFSTPEGTLLPLSLWTPQHPLNETYVLTTSVYFCNLKSKNPATKKNGSVLKYVHWYVKLFSTG